jgi:hypothetical protein
MGFDLLSEYGSVCATLLLSRVSPGYFSSRYSQAPKAVFKP